MKLFRRAVLAALLLILCTGSVFADAAVPGPLHALGSAGLLCIGGVVAVASTLLYKVIKKRKK